jgi:hypothetical protein
MMTSKMIGLQLAIATLIWSASTAWADRNQAISDRAAYPSARAAALDLAQKGNPEAAAAEFLRLSESQIKAEQKNNALFNAALCWQIAKRPAEAMEAARKISSPPFSTACQMELLARSAKWGELLTLSASEDFKTWPDRLISNAYLNRAKAHQAKGDTDAAKADLVLARESTVSTRQKAKIATLLGSM